MPCQYAITFLFYFHLLLQKHRSNSKFSFQGWVGGLSKKQNPNVVIHEAPHVHDHGSVIASHSEPISITKDSSAPDTNISNNTNNVSNEDKNDVDYLDKCVVSHVDDHKTGYDHEPPQIDNLVFPKIKFGNLDDIKFGDIGNEVIEDDSTSSMPPSTEPKEKEIVPNVEENIKSQKIEEVKEVSSEDIKIKIVNEEVIGVSDKVSKELDKNLNTENLVASGSENLVTSRDSCFLQDSESMSDEKAITKNSTSEESSDKKTVSALNDLSGVEIEGGESKERFRQRLWCFLFENLNRAVDELYLLCELECDIDQTKEAVLVLEEAASDFKELNCRVEEFENVKKSSDNPPPMTMKSEQRRPHALSWEVRMFYLIIYIFI